MHKIVVINLDKRKDRLDRMQKYLGSFGLSFIRIAGIDAYQYCNNFKIRKPTAGCLAAHLQAIALAKAMNWDSVTVFEDDIEFTDFNKWKEFRERVKQDWDVLIYGCLPVTPKTPIDDITAQITQSAGMYAYTVKRHFYDTILTIGIEQPYDVSMFELQKKYKFYAPHKGLVKVITDWSDIKGKMHNRKEFRIADDAE